jgi:hypothetical protein
MVFPVLQRVAGKGEDILYGRKGLPIEAWDPLG